MFSVGVFFCFLFLIRLRKELNLEKKEKNFHSRGIVFI